MRRRNEQVTNVKTAISIPAPLYAKVEELAQELHMSRSGLYVQALEAFIRQMDNHVLLEQINRAYADDSTDDATKTGDETLRHATQRQYRRLVEDAW
jgi:metal-responsive CopG/Arc/MetJ family transcriptional regulator